MQRNCIRDINTILFLLAAELLTRIKVFVRPSPAFYHYILTRFKWFWDILNNTFIRDTIVRLVLTGKIFVSHEHLPIDPGGPDKPYPRSRDKYISGENDQVDKCMCGNW